MKHFLSILILVASFGICQAQQFQDTASKTVATAQPQSLGWVQQNSGTTRDLGVLSWPSRDTAFAYPYGGVDILRSTNGGAGWQSLPVPIKGFFGFETSQIGYIAKYDGDTCYFTHDGGQTWTAAEDSGQLVRLVVPVTRDTAFLIGDQVNRTTDGGKTWNRKEFDWNHINGASFFDSKHGVLVGNVQPGPLPQHHELTAGCFTTSDGGESWVQQFTGAPSDFQAVSWATSNIILGVELLSRMRRSNDSGRSWKLVDSVTSGAHLYSSSMHVGTGFVVGSGGTILHTIDTGASWAAQLSGVSSDLLSVAAFDDSTALASGKSGVVLRTSNGGADWVQTSPPSFQDLQATIFPDPSPGEVQIGYSLPQTQDVTLTIIDVVGRIVATPVARMFQTAGPHTSNFDGSRLPAGTYTYQIQTERFSTTGKFTIVK